MPVSYTHLKNRIFNVLEGIFSLHAHIRKMQIGRTHHEILALGVTVLHLDPPNRPAKFRGNDVAAPHPDVAAFPQCFDAVELGILNDDMAGIPPVSYTHLDVYKRQAP